MSPAHDHRTTTPEAGVPPERRGPAPHPAPRTSPTVPPQHPKAAEPEPEAEPATAGPESGTSEPEPATAGPRPAAEDAATDGPEADGPTSDVPPADVPAPRARRRPRTVAALAVGAVLVAAAATATALAVTGGGTSGPPAAHRTAAAERPEDGLTHTAVEISTGACGRGWTHPHAGTQAFDLHNTGTVTADAYLTDPATGKLYAESEGLAPGRTRSMVVDLGSGTYAFRCLQEDADAVTGPTVTVPGSVPRGPGALPVTEHDLVPIALAYQRWIGGRMAELAHGTAALKADIGRGDLAAARRDWLAAHLVYERMGAAYGTFGDADGVINGVADRSPGGVRAASFTGFHRVEYGLWHGGTAASLAGPAGRLDDAVRALAASWAQARMDPADLGLRAHEILENTGQSELTGRTDYGSGTGLATARANLDGTRELLGLLRPLLAARDPRLPQLDAALDRLQSALDAARHGDAWTAPDALPQAQRERIDADLGAALEDLAPVATLFDVRRTA